MTLAKVETLNFDAAELNRAVFTHLTWADVGVEAPEGYDFEVARQKLQSNSTKSANTPLSMKLV